MKLLPWLFQVLNSMMILKSGLKHSLSIKFDERNFLMWSQQVNGVIIAHSLHHFILNPSIPLQFASHDHLENNTSAEYQKWLKQDQILFTWLLSSLSDNVLPRVLGCKHAYQVWNTRFTSSKLCLGLVFPSLDPSSR